MANSAKAQVEKVSTPVRPATASRGGKAARKLMFDTVQKGMILPAQINLVIDAYFDLLQTGHEPISIEEISDKADLIGLGYSQDGVTIIAHYKKEIEGTKSWKHKQGEIQIGCFS